MEHFCTCPETDCKNHPRNHSQGCDLCIQKNLRLGEIPSCFFLKVHNDIHTWDDFSINGFLAFVQAYADKQ